MEGVFKKNYSYVLISAANQAKCIQINQNGRAVVYDFQGTINQKYTFQYEAKNRQYKIKSILNQ
jgi:hypothetical protein